MAKATAKQPTTSRLPATRESRPALLGLAILLIVGGALASAFLAMQAGNRAYFVQVSQEVAQGSKITEEDLDRVSLPEGFDGGIPSDEVDSVVGKSAATRLLPGTVLSKAMVSDQAGIAEGQAQLAIPVPASPFVRGLDAGAPLALNVGGGGSGSTRQSILAELVTVGRSTEGGIGGSEGDVQIVVSLDQSCLGAVSQGIDDKSVTPALVGGDSGTIKKTCGG